MHRAVRGNEKINSAISQIDEVTQQNAALVEEAVASGGFTQEHSGAERCDQYRPLVGASLPVVLAMRGATFKDPFKARGRR